MRRLDLVALAALLLLAPARSEAGIEKAGTTAAGFLSVGAGADVLGMGGAGLALGTGLGAGAWNVASLSGLQGTEYVFSHASLSGASPQDWVAAGGRFGASRTRWGLSGLYQGDGSFEGRDAANNPTGSFNASSMAVGFQIAQGLGDVAALGFGVKYASEKLGDVTGGGLTFDAGLRVQAGPLGFGVAAQNAFGKMSYGDMTYDFPTNYGAGASFALPGSGLTLALDANFPNAYYQDVRGGLEWRWRDRVALRTGYRKELGAEDGEPLGGPTFGMGAGANNFWVDYGFLTGGASGGGQHRIGLTYRPGFMNLGAEEPTPRATRTAEPRATSRKVESAVVPMRESKPEPKPAPAKVEKAVTPEPVAAPVKSAVEAPKPVATPPAAPESAKPAAKAAATTPAPETAKPAAKVTTPAATEPAKPAVVKPAVPAPAVTKPVATPAAPKTEKPAAPKPEPAKVVPAETKVEAPKKAAVAETPKPAPVETKAETKAEAPKPEAPKPAAPEASETAKPAPAPAVEKPAKEAPKDMPRPEKVKVKSGETLADIAKRWGTSVPAIMMENDMVSEQVKSGQTLKLPPKGR